MEHPLVKLNIPSVEYVPVLVSKDMRLDPDSPLVGQNCVSGISDSPKLTNLLIHIVPAVIEVKIRMDPLITTWRVVRIWRTQVKIFKGLIVNIDVRISAFNHCKIVVPLFLKISVVRCETTSIIGQVLCRWGI